MKYESDVAFYNLRATDGMIGKTYFVTVQAVNKAGKVSQLSQPVSFTLHESPKILPNGPVLSPIIGLSSSRATVNRIDLVWPAVHEAT